MARPVKHDLRYFPLDVDLFEDHKMLMIEEDFGVKGGYLAIRLMAMVYRQGYYLQWKEGFELSCAKRVGNGYTGALVCEILNSCLKHGLFDKAKFDQYRILTSRGIQKRWLDVMIGLRRKVEIIEAFWLVSSEEMRVSSEETPPKRAESTQKEIKVNESKVKEKEDVISPVDVRGEVLYNVEELILNSQIVFEKILMAAGVEKEIGQEELRKYHLYLEEKEQYPKPRKALIAGFEKWLLNAKKFNNARGKSDRPVNGKSSKSAGANELAGKLNDLLTSYGKGQGS